MEKLLQKPCPINPVFEKYNWKQIHQNMASLSNDFVDAKTNGKERPASEAANKMEEMVRHAALLS